MGERPVGVAIVAGKARLIKSRCMHAPVFDLLSSLGEREGTSRYLCFSRMLFTKPSRSFSTSLGSGSG